MTYEEWLNACDEGQRVFCIGVTRRFRVVEKSPTCLYVEQAVGATLTEASGWRKLAMATSYRESTDALFTLQEHYVKELARRRRGK